MSTTSRFRRLTTFVLLLIVVATISSGTTIRASSFRSSGDLISGWYWLRDASLAHQAWWTFEGIPPGDEDVVLEITCLATSRASGPRGVPATFRLGYGFPGAGMMGGAFTVQEVTLPNVSPPTDPVGYTCLGAVVIPRSTPGLATGTLTVFAERISPAGPHVAFNRESIVIRVPGARGAEEPLVGMGVPCHRVVDGLTALTAALEIPQHLAQENAVKVGTEFDANSYFSVLDRLTMEPGYVLDYVYLFQSIGGRPVLYARPESQPPFAAYEDLAAALPDPQGAYLRHVQIDTTPEGYLQFVVLAIMGEQFYLYWHAFYNDTTPVCSRQAVERVLDTLDGSFGWAMLEEDKERARALDVEPWVFIGDEVVTVRLVTFSLWGGFSETIYTIARSFPHQIIDVQSSTLVEYDCGVVF